VLSNGIDVELLAANVPESVPSLFVEVEVADRGLGILVKNTGHGRLGDDELGHLLIEEVHWVVLKFASLSIVDHLTEEEQVNVALSNVRSHGVSIVNCNVSRSCLSSREVGRNVEVKLIVVKELSENGADHAIENVLAYEVNGVLNNNDGKFDKLMHHEGNDGVVVVEVGVSELDVDSVDDWIEVTFWLKSEVAVEVEIEVLELKLHLAKVGENP
jgi:hypothetical protein